MAARVTNEQVVAIAALESDQDTEPAIATATLLVDEVLVGKGLTDERLAQIELYLAAHFAKLTHSSGPLAAETLGEATERYHNIYKAGLRATIFGQQAILLDTTETLADMAAKSEMPGKKDATFEVI